MPKQAKKKKATPQPAAKKRRPKRLTKAPSRTETAKKPAKAGAGVNTTGGGVGLPVKTKGDVATAGALVVDTMVIDTGAAPRTGAPATVRPPATNWQIAKRELPKGQQVKLAPHIKLDKAGKIAGVATGRTRTPSPFGARMGDHTVAWTAVVDGVHALVFGKSLADAYAELTRQQEHAEAWMKDNDSVGARLWDTLPAAERLTRQPVLESYAAEVKEALKDPPTEAGLAKAISYHLAFLNFLPYATVPAAGVIGSKGSGEGAARAAALVLDMRVEDAKRQTEETPEQTARRQTREAEANKQAELLEKEKQSKETEQQTAQRHAAEQEAAKNREQGVLDKAHEGLWKLLSFEAAVRDSRADRVIAPERHQQLLATVEATRKAGETAAKLAAQFAVSESVSGARRTASFRPDEGIDQFNEDLQGIKDAAAGLGDLSKTGYPVLADLKSDIQALALAAGTVSQQVTTKVEGAVKILALGESISDRLAIVESLYDDLTTDPAVVEDEAALILGYLLHEHQTTVARSYPVAVRQTGFLGDDPAKAAVARLGMFLRKDAEKRPFEEEAVTRLLDKVEQVHRKLGGIPVPTEPNRWVGAAHTADIVVTFPDNNKVTIHGRAAAPSGVEGLGSHTTAWVTEVKAVERIVADLGTEGVTGELRTQTLDELEGELMTKLAVRLPVEQLEAGQLGDIFDAALEVLESTTPADAVAAYLQFRNLLPYATVDAGDRGGHGERSDGTLEELFDGDSLQAAINEKLDELKPENLVATTAALRDTAGVLRETLNATKPPAPTTTDAPTTATTTDAPTTATTTDAPATATTAATPAEPITPSWHTDQRLKAVVDKTITALETHAGELEAAAKTESGLDLDRVGEEIYNVRLREHTRVYNSRPTTTSTSGPAKRKLEDTSAEQPAAKRPRKKAADDDFEPDDFEPDEQ